MMPMAAIAWTSGSVRYAQTQEFQQCPRKSILADSCIILYHVSFLLQTAFTIFHHPSP